MKTALLLILTYNLSAQNIIVNGSFEQGQTPITSGEYYKADHWQSTQGSPDYFSTTALITVNIPNTFVGGTIKPKEGQRFMGLCTFMKGVPNYREYLTQKFDTALAAGTSYHLSMWVLTNTNPCYYGGLTSDNFGVLFSTKKPHSNSDGVIVWQPTMVYPYQVYATHWQELVFDFIADSNYKFVTLGCYVYDSTQVRITTGTAITFECVYLFVDNIKLEKQVNTSVNNIGPLKAVKLNKYNLLGQRVK